MCTVHVQKLLLRTGQAFILLAGTLFLGVGLATAADGGIVLDASLSDVSGAGAVWSNLPIGSLKSHAMDSGHMAIESTDVITITNVIGSGGTLQQSPAEQTASFASYGNLSAGGGAVDALNLFGTVATELFDFPRYRAVAAATNNLYTACEFARKVAANATLYGIVYVEINVANDQGVSTEYVANSDCRNTNGSGNLTVAGTGSGVTAAGSGTVGPGKGVSTLDSDQAAMAVADPDCHNQSKFVSKFVEIRTDESGNPLEHVANSDYPEHGGTRQEYKTWPEHMKQGGTRQEYETWPEHMKHGVTKQEYKTWPEHMKHGVTKQEYKTWPEHMKHGVT
ncbi:MAG TPA: hypothetical protein EYM83_00100, partial [Nitrospirales bacterium]|nr:hypothetical protein [Nitrospirales bacterium]